MKTFRRPMFRKGGSVNSGIMSGMRENFQDKGMTDATSEAIKKRAQLYRQYAGDPIANLLIQGGLGLVSGKGAGKGTLGAIATAYEEPTQRFLSQEQQIGLKAVGDVLAEEQAFKLQKLKSAQKQMRTEQVTPAFENVVLNKAKSYENTLPYELKNKAIDAARKDTMFQRTAPDNLKRNYVGVPTYTSVQRKGKPVSVPVLDNIQVGQIFYEVITGQYKKRISKGNGALDYVTIDPVTFKELKASGD